MFYDNPANFLLNPSKKYSLKSLLSHPVCSINSTDFIHIPKLLMELPQVRCVRWRYAHICTWLCVSVHQLAWLLPGIITIWNTKEGFDLTAVQGRAGCRCNILLSILISFRLPGRWEALTDIYCHLTRPHLLCFTAQHAGWGMPFEMDKTPL